MRGGLGAAQGFGGAREGGQFGRTEQLPEAEGEVLDAIDFGGGAMFEQKIAVGGFPAGNRIENHHWFAHGQGQVSSRAAAACK